MSAQQPPRIRYVAALEVAYVPLVIIFVPVSVFVNAPDHPAGCFHFEAYHALPVDSPIMCAFSWHHSVARDDIAVV
jgi:hypothetical protein